MSLMDGLGLDQVEADPNALPDGRWMGVVFKSQYVHIKKKNEVAHVITYKVTDGEKAGAQRPEFFTIGKDPVFAEDGKTIVSCTPTMSEQQKPWYKKRFVDLGIPESMVTKTPVEDLVGKEVVFGTKKNDGFINISFVELRGASAAAAAPTGSAAPQTAPTQTNLTGLI